MTRFEDMTDNIEQIKIYIHKGYISCALIKHFQIYKCYDSYRKLGNKVNKAVFFTSEDMQVQERWVYNIIKKMEKEI